MSIRVKLVIAALALGGVALFVIAATQGSDDPSDVSITRTDGVAALIPGRDDEVLSQQEVGIQLDPEYRLVSLRIFDNADLNGGVDVTADVTVFDGLNRYVYFPDEDLPVAQLSADDNCAVARFERVSRPGEVSSIDWCFTAS